jgi:hypothetical protein
MKMLWILPQKNTLSLLVSLLIENIESNLPEKTVKNKLEAKPKLRTRRRSAYKILKIYIFFRVNNEKWIKKNYF